MKHVILSVFDLNFTYYFRCRITGVPPEDMYRAQGPTTPPLAHGLQQSAYGTRLRHYYHAHGNSGDCAHQSPSGDFADQSAHYNQR